MNACRTLVSSSCFFAGLIGLAWLAGCSSGGGSASSAGSGGSGGSGGVPTWAKSFGGPDEDYANDAVPTADGGYVFTGARRDPATGDQDVWVARLDAAGNPLWQRTAGELHLQFRLVKVVREGPGGVVWSAGTPAANTRIFVSRHSAAGVPLPESLLAVEPHPQFPSWGSQPTVHTQSIDIWPTKAGGAYLATLVSERVLMPTGAGATQARWSSSLQVYSLDNAGNVAWSRRLVHPGAELLPSPNTQGRIGVAVVRETPDGGAVIALEARADLEQRLWLVALGSDGSLNWTRDVEEPLPESFSVADMLLLEDPDAAGDIVVLADAYPKSWLLRLDAVGNERWRTSLDEEAIAVVERCPAAASERCSLYVLGENDSTPVLVRIVQDADGIEETSRSTHVDLNSPFAVRTVPPNGTGTDGAAVELLTTFASSTGRLTLVITTVGEDHAVLGQRILASPGIASSMSRPTFTSDGGALAENPALTRWLPAGEVLWSQPSPEGDGSLETGDMVFAGPDGGFVVAAARGGETDPIPWLLRFSANGDLEWQRAYEGLRWPSPKALRRPAAMAPNGELWLGGITEQDEFRLLKLDAGGTPLWSTPPLAITRDDGLFRWGAAVAANAMGAVVLVRRALIEPSDENSATPTIVRIDSSGSVLWQRRTDLAAVALDLFESGDVLVASYFEHSPMAARLDAATGGTLWAYEYALPELENADIAAIRARSDGGVWMGLSTYRDWYDPAAHTNIALLRIDPEGRALSYELFGGLHDETLRSLTVLDDDGLLLAGQSDSMGDLSEAWLLRLDADARIAAGCNAALGGGLTSADAEVGFFSTPFEVADAPLADGVLLAQITSVGSRPLTDTVVARQCSGFARTASPDDPSEQFTLTVEQAGASQGVVTSTPAGIVCGTLGGGTCTARFEAGTAVFLEVDFASLGRFARWEGCDALEGTVCRVELDSDRTIRAFFEPPEESLISLSVSIAGEGTVQTSDGRIGCTPTGGACSSSYVNSETVTLTATPAAGQRFLGWAGDCAAFGVATTGELRMDAARNCTASFGAAGFALTFSAIDAPGAVIISYGEGFETSTTCLSACTRTFPADTRVYVRWGAAGPGAEFLGWGGDCAEFGGDSQFFLTMNRDYVCSANFE